MPRTSFLLPVRNGATTLGVALRSILAQTDPDLEVVVVDDGSTDGSAQIAEDIEDTRICVLQQPPLGIAMALQEGLQHASGEFIARMDADDRTDPRRLERQLPVLEANRQLGLVDAQVELFREGSEVPEGMKRYASFVNAMLSPEDFDRALLQESPVVHPAATLRRSAVAQVGGYRQGDFPEDYDLWLRMEYCCGCRTVQRAQRGPIHATDPRPFGG